MTLPTIGYIELLFALAPIILVMMIFQRWSLSVKDLFIATIRMVIQLIAIGFLLIYLFAYDNGIMGVAIMSVMVVISGWIALRPLEQKNVIHLQHLSFSLLLGCGVILFLILWCVLKLEPWYQPRYVIPLAGMLLANTMNCLSLAGERFESELKQMNEPEAARNKAFNTAMIPQVNSLLAVGIVALPGMMTGQILSGVSPLIAVRYQIVIMAAILCSAAFSVAMYLTLRLALIIRQAKTKD